VPESHLKSYSLKKLADDTLESSLDLNVACNAWSAIEKVTIALPTNIEIMNLPANVHEAIGAVEYRAEYSIVDGRIVVERRYLDRSPRGQCTPSETRDQMEIARVVMRDLQRLILYRPAPNL
jgi:hypothetical protein